MHQRDLPLAWDGGGDLKHIHAPPGKQGHREELRFAAVVGRLSRQRQHPFAPYGQDRRFRGLGRWLAGCRRCCCWQPASSRAQAARISASVSLCAWSTLVEVFPVPVQKPAMSFPPWPAPGGKAKIILRRFSDRALQSGMVTTLLANPASSPVGSPAARPDPATSACALQPGSHPLPALQPAAEVLRRDRHQQAPRVPGLDLLGEAGSIVWRREGSGVDCGPGSGCAWFQSNWQAFYRRRLRRLPVSRSL